MQVNIPASGHGKVWEKRVGFISFSRFSDFAATQNLANHRLEIALGLALRFCQRGRAQNGLGRPKGCTNPNLTPNTLVLYRRSQTMGAKFHSREGNSPDRQLRPLNVR